MANKQRSIVLVCYQIDDNMRLWRFVKQSGSMPGIGEGNATRKWDGMAVLHKDGEWYFRYDAKKGRTPPDDFIPAQPAPDPVTGHWPGWVKPGKGQDKYFLEAKGFLKGECQDGTYELCGPSIGTRHGPNPENLDHHVLIRHGSYRLPECPRDYNGIKEYLRDKPIEGIVWWHEDGRMVKIKKADFPY